MGEEEEKKLLREGGEEGEDDEVVDDKSSSIREESRRCRLFWVVDAGTGRTITGLDLPGMLGAIWSVPVLRRCSDCCCCCCCCIFDLFLLALSALALDLLRFLMTSDFRLSGRTTPCSLRKSPHALQRGFPSGSLRHNGVVVVLQLVHFVLPLLLLLLLLSFLFAGCWKGVDVDLLVVSVDGGGGGLRG